MDAEQIQLVPLETIDIYLQILKPAYLFSIQFQSSNSKRSETIPCVLKLINDDLAW